MFFFNSKADCEKKPVKQSDSVIDMYCAAFKSLTRGGGSHGLTLSGPLLTCSLATFKFSFGNRYQEKSPVPNLAK